MFNQRLNVTIVYISRLLESNAIIPIKDTSMSIEISTLLLSNMDQFELIVGVKYILSIKSAVTDEMKVG